MSADGLDLCAVSLASARDWKNRTVSLPAMPVDARCITTPIVQTSGGFQLLKAAGTLFPTARSLTHSRPLSYPSLQLTLDGQDLFMNGLVQGGMIRFNPALTAEQNC